MFENIRGIVINHIGLIIITIIVIISMYFIITELKEKNDSTVKSVVELTDVIDSNTQQIYNNKILTGSQVLSTIERYFNNNDVIILLLNNSKDYDNANYRFWVTGKGGRYGQNTNYESIIISSNYTDVNQLVIQEKSINNKYPKQSLKSYKEASSKNYININGKYKSVLIKCNDVVVGIALLSI